MRAEGRDSLVGLALKVKAPCFIRAYHSSHASLDGDLIRPHDSLPVEYEERCDFVCLPTVQVGFDVRLNASQAAQGR
jgi:hypothetical protein